MQTISSKPITPSQHFLWISIPEHGTVVGLVLWPKFRPQEPTKRRFFMAGNDTENSDWIKRIANFKKNQLKEWYRIGKI